SGQQRPTNGHSPTKDKIPSAYKPPPIRTFMSLFVDQPNCLIQFLEQVSEKRWGGFGQSHKSNSNSNDNNNNDNDDNININNNNKSSIIVTTTQSKSKKTDLPKYPYDDDIKNIKKKEIDNNSEFDINFS